MSKNDMIAEYIKEKYPELLETSDFAYFQLRKAALKMRNDIAEGLKTFFDSFKKELEKLNKEWKKKAHLFQRAEQNQDGFRANIIICDEIEHEKKHQFSQKVSEHEKGEKTQ